MMKKILFLLFPFFIIQNGFSQDIDAKSPQYFFSISPQYIVINGFRVDFEKRFKESVHGIVFSPTYYLGTIDYDHLLNSSYYSETNAEYELSGFGFEIGHKIYSDKSWSKNINWYQSYSLTYNHLNMDYSSLDWVPFEGDPTLLTLGPMDQRLTINQFGISAFMGAVANIDKNFYTDVYFGIGAKQSTADDSSTGNFAEDEFTNGFINYNFTGALLRAGFKIGFVF